MSEKQAGSEAVRSETNGKHAGESLRLSPEMIASQARILWEQRGCPDIDPQTFFPEAEAQLRKELDFTYEDVLHHLDDRPTLRELLDELKRKAEVSQ